MYKYKLKENSKFEVGDVEIKGGKKSTISHINPTTGAITWDLEDVGAFDTVYKTFDKLNQLIKTLESEGEAEADPKIDSIAEKVKDLFNDYRTHIRKNYPEAYERVLRLKESVNEVSLGHAEVRKLEKTLSPQNKKALAKAIKDGTIKTSEDLSNWAKSIDESVLIKEGELKDVQTIEKLLKRINNKKEWGELINKLVSHEVPTLTGMGKKKHLLAITKQLKEDLSIKGKKVKTIHKNDSNNPEDHTIEYEDGSTEPYLDHLKEGTFHGPREIAIYDGPDGETYIEKRGTGYYGYNNSFDFEAEDKAELKWKLDSWGYRLIAGSIDESVNESMIPTIRDINKMSKDQLISIQGILFGRSDQKKILNAIRKRLEQIDSDISEDEGISYLTPDAFDKNKKSTGASDIYYYKLGFKPVPKKIKGAGTIVKQLWEKEELTEYSDFQQKRISTFDEVEEKINSLSPLLSNAKNETAKYYNENPGSYAIVYSTDMVSELLGDITDLLKQTE